MAMEVEFGRWLQHLLLALMAVASLVVVECPLSVEERLELPVASSDRWVRFASFGHHLAFVAVELLSFAGVPSGLPSDY